MPPSETWEGKEITPHDISPNELSWETPIIQWDTLTPKIKQFLSLSTLLSVHVVSVLLQWFWNCDIMKHNPHISSPPSYLYICLYWSYPESLKLSSCAQIRSWSISSSLEDCSEDSIVCIIVIHKIPSSWGGIISSGGNMPKLGWDFSSYLTNCLHLGIS